MNDLRQDKITLTAEMTEQCRSLLSASTVFNAISVIVLIYERSFSLVVVIAGLISFFTAFKSLRIIHKNHIIEGKTWAIFNLIFSSFLLLFFFVLIGVGLWAITHISFPFL